MKRNRIFYFILILSFISIFNFILLKIDKNIFFYLNKENYNANILNFVLYKLFINFKWIGVGLFCTLINSILLLFPFFIFPFFLLSFLFIILSYSYIKVFNLLILDFIYGIGQFLILFNVIYSTQIEKYKYRFKILLIYFLLFFLWINSSPLFFIGLINIFWFYIIWKISFSSKKEENIKLKGKTLLILLIFSIFSPFFNIFGYNFLNFSNYLYSVKKYLYFYDNFFNTYYNFWSYLFFFLFILLSYFIFRNKEYKYLILVFHYFIISLIFSGWYVPTLFIYLFILSTIVLKNKSLNILLKDRFLENKIFLIFISIIYGVLIFYNVFFNNFLLIKSLKSLKYILPCDKLKVLNNVKNIDNAFIDRDLKDFIHLFFKSNKIKFLKEDETQKRIILSQFRKFIEENNINILILDYKLIGTLDILNYLKDDIEWRLFYCDYKVIVFIKRGVKLDNLFDKLPILIVNKKDKNATYIKLLLYQSWIYLNIDLISECKNIINYIKKEFPNFIDNYIFKLIEAKFYILKGEKEKGINLLENIIKKEINKEVILLLIQSYLQEEKEKYLNNAYNICNKYFEKFKNIPKFLYLYAQVLHLKDKKEEAIYILNILLEKYPDYTEAQYYLNEIKKEIQEQNFNKYFSNAKKLIKLKKYDLALKLLEKIKNIQPDFYEIYLEIGNIYLIIKDYHRAEYYFQKAIEKNPENLLSKTKLAICISYLGKWRTGLKILEDLSKKYKDRYEVRDALYVVDNIAIKKLEHSIKNNKKDIFLLCKILDRREKYKQGINILIKYKSKFIKFKKYKKLLRNFYFKEGRRLINNKKVKEGVKYLRESLKYDPIFFQARFLLGIIFLKRKEWRKAKKEFDILKKYYPDDERVLNGKALIELGKGLSFQFKGMFDKALEKFSLYLKEAPTSEDKKILESIIKNLYKYRKQLKKRLKNISKREYFIKAIKLLKNNKLELAKKILKKVIKIDSNYTQAYFYLAQIYIRQKKYDKAILNLKKVLKLNPKYGEAYLSLGFIYYYQSKYKLAKENFKKYLNLSPKKSLIPKIEGIILGLEKIEKE